MQRMLLLWSLFIGLALVGTDWYVARGRAAASPGYEGGTPAVSTASVPEPSLWEDGTPIPPK